MSKYSNIPRMLLCNNFIIDWSAKAGCTVAIKMWFDYLGVLEDANRYSYPRKWIHDFRVDVFYERFGYANQSHIDSSDFIKIKYVRNPFTRVVSSYLHGIRSKLFSSRFCPHWPDNIGDKNEISFYEFVNLLFDEKFLCSGGGHWRIQNMYPDINYDEVVKIEKLQDGVENLNKKYNLNLKWDFGSGHHLKKKTKIDNFYEKSASDVLKYLDENKEVPTYDSFYNNEIKEMVYKIYEVDIETYGYDYDL
jgi:hypothetical protein